VLSLATGAVIGALVGLGMILRLRAQLAQLRRKLRQVAKDADQLRVLPVKE
jgi:hypothetical protein